MHFDVPKVVRSPGCDHGHDEESQNGRDIKIDILEAYVWTSEVFRVKSGFYRVTGRVTGTPREPYGPSWALVERRKGQPKGAARLLPFGLFPLFPYGPIRPIYSPANSRNSPVLRKIPESLGTFPNSEYSRPIYRSLCLDHFETPRHVPGLIRDSELLRYIKTHKLII